MFGGAIEAILGGGEQATRKLLDTIPLTTPPKAIPPAAPASAGDIPAGRGQDHSPRPLPFRPRPMAGDTVASYVRRLARANHLRPGYLHRYLQVRCR